MDHVSKPLIGVLVATVLFFALWVVALKPSSNSGGGGLGRYQPAINAAKASAKAQDKAAAAGGGSVATTPVHTVSTAAKPAATAAKPPAATVKPATTKPATAASSFTAPRAGNGPSEVDAALTASRPVAVLFYNPASAVDRAVRSGLDGLRVSKRVLKLAVPVSQIGTYAPFTTDVSVNQTPTLVIVSAAHQATTITGFTTPFEISYRIADALAATPAKGS
jgi:hypothetical protein